MIQANKSQVQESPANPDKVNEIFSALPSLPRAFASPVILGLNSKIQAVTWECCYFFHMILSFITVWSQMKNLRLLVDVPSSGASCNTHEKFRTCSICLLKSWNAAMLKMCVRKGHEELEEVDAHFKHSLWKCGFNIPRVHLEHTKKEYWNSGIQDIPVIHFWIVLSNYGDQIATKVCFAIETETHEPILTFKNSTHLAPVWLFSNTTIMTRNLEGRLGFKQGVDIGIKSNMNVWWQ